MEFDGLKYFKLTEFATAPVRGSPEAAGCDLKCAYIVPPHGVQLIKTDLSFQLPKGTYGRIAARSGIALRQIDVGGGVVDCDYTGNVGVILYNHSDIDFIVKRGDHIAQIILEVYRNDLPIDGGIDNEIRNLDIKDSVQQVPYDSPNDRTRHAALTCCDALVWQSLASVVVPGVTINRLCWATRLALVHGAKVPKIVSKYVSVAVGLAAIPFIIKPIDNAVDHAMDLTIRPWIFKPKD